MPRPTDPIATSRTPARLMAALVLLIALSIPLEAADAQTWGGPGAAPTATSSPTAVPDSAASSPAPAASSTLPAASSPDPAAAPTAPAGLLVADDAGFLVGDWDFLHLPWRRLPLNGGPLLPVRIDGPQDENGVPMRVFTRDKRLAYNPTVLGQQGMKRLDAWVRTQKPVQLRRARAIARVLDETAVVGSTRRWQPHWYERGRQGLGQAWVNANSHGLVLSFLSRFYALRGGDERRDAIDALAAAYDRRRRHPRWFTTVTPGGYLWFEHWPDGRQKHVLNAHLNALFGLYDYWRATGSPEAELYLQGAARTVRDQLHRFRRPGRLSRYSLSDVVESLHYHHTHIRQLRALARMTGDDWFTRQAKRFEQDERTWRANGMPE